MKHITILIDMDDTIENLTYAWVEYLNKRHGTTTNREDLLSWDITQAFPTLSADEVFHPLYEDEFWENVLPIDGAAETIEKLIGDGNEIYIVTSSAYQTLKSKMENVLFKYFPFITWDNVIVAGVKQMIHGDVLIDDGVHNLINGDYIRILMDAPYNRSFDAEASGITRVYDWDEIYRLISRIQFKPRYQGVKCTNVTNDLEYPKVYESE